MFHRYGQELVLDLFDCNVELFTRENIEKFARGLCDDVLSVERHDLHFWDYEDDPAAKAEAPAHLKGVTAVQFLSVSNVTVHTLDDLREVYLNVFTCGELDAGYVRDWCAAWFEGRVRSWLRIDRGPRFEP